MTNEQVDACLERLGIDMQPAFVRLRKMISHYRERKAMSVRAKFVCESKVQNADSGEVEQISLRPVIDGSEENKAFYRATPGGNILLSVLNPEAAKKFEPGKSYYVDFHEVQEPVNLGKIGYDAYCKSSGGVSLVSGAKLPEWSALAENIRNAWESAAESIVGMTTMGSPDAA